ncbi:MAG: iron-sulfur cluster assembly scaffold protein [Pseudomonadota bacterium]
MDAVNKSKNAHIGEVANPDGEGFHGSLVCGDAMKFTFRVQKDDLRPENDIITEAKYLTFGCTSAIAASEAVCAIVEHGKYTPIKALSITKDDVIKFLEGLPTQKIHCSIMGIEALYAAVYDWAKKRGVDLTKFGVTQRCDYTDQDDENRIVCRCMGLTKKYIREQIKDLKLKTVDDVVNTIKAGSVCGSCIDEKGGIKDILAEVYGKKEAGKTAPRPEKTPYQIAKEIERVLATDVMPILERDGGGLEIVDIKGYELYFKLKGACKVCHSANNTIEYTIQKILRDKVGENVKVINVG